MTNNIKTLADRAMLAKLTRSRIRTSFRDKDLETTVRATSGDDSITVHKHLFRDKNNPVRALLRKADEVYRVHKDATLPWVDAGPRLLRSDKYFDYMQDMRTAIAAVDADKPAVINNWSQLVQDDIASRGGAACINDYPTREQADTMFGFDVQVYPLPDTRDFRIDVGDEAREALQAALQDAEARAKAEVVRRMMDPISKAAEKLSVPIGEQGHIFRDSLIENLKASIAQAREINISDDPELAELIDTIDREIANSTVVNKEALRTQQGSRDEAKAKLDDILGRLGQIG